MDIKERIIEGSAELFKTYGIKSVTMDSIANHFGISKRTIYEIFSDKDELLLAVLAKMAQQQKELAKRVLDESENSLVAIFRMFEINRTIFQTMSPAFQADLKKYHYDILIMNSENIELPDYRNNFQIIEKGIKEGLFRKDINPELANRCLFNLGRSIMDNELFPYEHILKTRCDKEYFLQLSEGNIHFKRS